MTLTDFLEARLDEAAAGSWAVHDVSKCDALLYEEDMAEAARRDPDCDCGYPARVLREVEAKRQILAEYERLNAAYLAFRHGANQAAMLGLRAAVEALAAVDSDHPDYAAALSG